MGTTLCDHVHKNTVRRKTVFLRWRQNPRTEGQTVHTSANGHHKG